MTEASTYENALEDMVFELNELMVQHANSHEETKRALMHIGGIVRNKFIAFELSKPVLSGPIADPDLWYIGTAK